MLHIVIAMVSPPSSSGSVERRDKRKEVGAGRDASNAVECRAHLIFVCQEEMVLYAD